VPAVAGYLCCPSLWCGPDPCHNGNTRAFQHPPVCTVYAETGMTDIYSHPAVGWAPYLLAEPRLDTSERSSVPSHSWHTSTGFVQVHSLQIQARYMRPAAVMDPGHGVACGRWTQLQPQVEAQKPTGGTVAPCWNKTQLKRECCWSVTTRALNCQQYSRRRPGSGNHHQLHSWTCMHVIASFPQHLRIFFSHAHESDRVPDSSCMHMHICSTCWQGQSHPSLSACISISVHGHVLFVKVHTCHSVARSSQLPSKLQQHIGHISLISAKPGAPRSGHNPSCYPPCKAHASWPCPKHTSPLRCHTSRARLWPACPEVQGQ
jgi:hypothetical protein